MTKLMCKKCETLSSIEKIAGFRNIGGPLFCKALKASPSGGLAQVLNLSELAFFHQRRFQLHKVILLLLREDIFLIMRKSCFLVLLLLLQCFSSGLQKIKSFVADEDTTSDKYVLCTKHTNSFV